MMLPSFPTYSKETDVNKQMAQMRNYLNMLKDEMENALNNIGYDQLDADLRKRIDELGDSVYANNNEILEIAGTLKTKYLTADEVASTYATFGWVSGNFATFNYLQSNYASFTYVDGNFATFDYLNTYYLTAETAILTYATITSLNGVDAKFNSLNADNINAGKLKLNRLEDANGSTGAAQWNLLSWVTRIEKSGDDLRVYYRTFKFLNSGYTSETVDVIPL